MVIDFAAAKARRSYPAREYLKILDRRIGGILRHYREVTELEPVDIALQLGVSSVVIECYDSGALPIPATHLSLYLKELRISPKVFLDDVMRAVS